MTHLEQLVVLIERKVVVGNVGEGLPLLGCQQVPANDGEVAGHQVQVNAGEEVEDLRGEQSERKGKGERRGGRTNVIAALFREQKGRGDDMRRKQ